MLKINNNWRINYEGSNCILQKLETIKVFQDGKQTGETMDDWKDKGFFSTVPNALWGLCQEEMKEPKNLDGLFGKIEELKKLFDYIKFIEGRN